MPPKAPPEQTAPGAAPPQYSPDGRWFFNGQQWVPVAMPPFSRKSKSTAAILAILLGDFGAHKFYLGKPGSGILYLVFFWTFIPGLIGVIEGIIYLTMNDQEFVQKYDPVPT